MDEMIEHQHNVCYRHTLTDEDMERMEKAGKANTESLLKKVFDGPLTIRFEDSDGNITEFTEKKAEKANNGTAQ